MPRRLPRAYAPVRYTVRQGPARRTRGPGTAAKALPEPGVRDAIAGYDSVFFGGAADHLQHGPDRPAGRDDAGRHRLGILGDPPDATVGGDEHHVERDQGVLH